jgi:hypothetical protein
MIPMNPASLSDLRVTFGERMQENVPLSSYTAARIGGPADVLVFVRNADELVQAGEKLWAMDMPFILLGGGSNVLVSDQGVRGVVIINRARLVKFKSQADHPTVHAETGVTPTILPSGRPAWGWPVSNGQPPSPDRWGEQYMATPAPLAEKWPGI